MENNASSFPIHIQRSLEIIPSLVNHSNEKPKKKEKCIGKANTAKMAQNQNSLKCGTFE